jgi:acyl-CoA synthetase (AMP-forming)/AMP-acid ligase II
MASVRESQTLLALLDAAPGGHVAVIAPDGGVRLTYDALRAQVGAAADAFAANGIGGGDRVALALANGLPAIVGILAASIAGTAAPLNPGYRYDEFRFYLEDTSARLLVLPPDGSDEARRAAADSGVPVITIDTDAGGAVTVAAPQRDGSVSAPAPDDVALVLHTSGSTGRPKRVPLTHGNLAVSAGNTARTYALGPEDVALCVMPLFHVHGLVASVLATFRSAGTVVMPGRFNPLAFWRSARDHRVTWYSAVPTIHQLLLARSGGERPAGADGLRFIRSCSAPLGGDIMQRLERAFGVPVLEAYGMTEAAHQMASNPLPPAPRKPGSVGPGTSVRIGIMGGDGRHRSPGEAGEVVIQGPNVIRGYENNPDANAAAFVDGWFRTGDQGVLDADGYLRLIGRIKELIIRGGEKIAPPEVDDVLLAHPAVAEAVAFGVPHPSWGEEVAAAVVLRGSASEADLLAHCRARMADFKCPKKIHIVTAIPRTATGKIQRRQVAAAFSSGA